MSLLLVASAVVAALLGIGVLRAGWPEGVPLRPYRFLIAALGTALGLGITSLLLFVSLFLAGGPGRGLIGAELVLLSLLALWIRRRPKSEPSTEAPASASERAGLARWVPAALAVTTCCAVAAFVGLSLAQPHGAWDAWMNWNLRARMIYRGGPEWRDAFSALLPWSHPDYPLLVQLSVVRTWIYAGRETLGGPALVAFVSTFTTTGVLAAAIAAFRGRTQGMLAALMLLATPFFIFHGVSQYGDVPVGLFYLSTAVFLALHDRHREQTLVFAGFAGFTAGLAAWTKNEGVLFLLAMTAAFVATGLRTRARGALGREVRGFVTGLLPMVAVLLFFKLRLAPANDLVTAAGGGHVLDWVLDPARYVQVVRAFVGQILSFGFNGLISAVGLLAIYSLCVGLRADQLHRRWVLAAGASVLLTLAGHGIILVTAVSDVPRMLASALDRLLLQLWPLVVLTWFALLTTPEELMQRDAGSTP